jgi:hypothetical protein
MNELRDLVNTPLGQMLAAELRNFQFTQSKEEKEREEFILRPLLDKVFDLALRGAWERSGASTENGAAADQQEGFTDGAILCEECQHAVRLHIEGGCTGASELCGCQEWEVTEVSEQSAYDRWIQDQRAEGVNDADESERD